MIKVTHITPHFGTGVGTVLRELSKKFNLNYKNYKHKYLALDFINKETKRFFKKNQISFEENLFFKKKKLKDYVKQSDIILIHWWNHPMLMEILANLDLPKNRLLIWSHITGSIAPNCITKRIIQFSDFFILSTPMFKSSRIYKNLNNNLKKKISTIWSTGGIERVKVHKKKKSKIKVIGYIGNLDFSKLHPNFVKMCASLKNKNVIFKVIGKKTGSLLNHQINKYQMNNRIIMEGYVSESKKWRLLSSFDIFGYPLARHHYGSCDQTIQEAMVAKVPVVALNNSMEKYMIKDTKTGLIANSESHYIKLIRKLINMNENKKNALILRAYNFAKDNYSIKKITHEWDLMFQKVLVTRKTKKFFFDSKLKPHNLYSKTLDDSCKYVIKFLDKKKVLNKDIEKVKKFCKTANWKSPTKSSPFHYQKLFPKNKRLNQLCEILKKN